MDIYHHKVSAQTWEESIQSRLWEKVAPYVFENIYMPAAQSRSGELSRKISKYNQTGELQKKQVFIMFPKFYVISHHRDVQHDGRHQAASVGREPARSKMRRGRLGDLAGKGDLICTESHLKFVRIILINAAAAKAIRI